MLTLFVISGSIDEERRRELSSLGVNASVPRIDFEGSSLDFHSGYGSIFYPFVNPPKLPSAATCMNLLKLPEYPNEHMLKEKLLYAIRSNSGFELT